MSTAVKNQNLTLWMPYISGGSGADVSTRYMANKLIDLGLTVHLQAFNTNFQFIPWILKGISAPVGTNLIVANSWNAFAFARPKCKLVVIDRLCVHDPALEPYKSFAQKIFHNYFVKRYVLASARRADASVAVSKYTADLYPKELNLPRPQAITNAVDTDFFTPCNSYKKPINDRNIRLLFVGNLTTRKGADMLSPIMQKLGGGYELFYTAGLRKNNLPNQSPNMYPLGRLDQYQMREQYQKADLLIFPSRAEGLPRAVMESLACGTPVVSTDASSMPEAIDETVGVLCPRDDIDSFVAGVKKLTSSQTVLDKLSANARIRAVERFSLTRMINEYISLFSTLIENHHQQTEITNIGDDQ